MKHKIFAVATDFVYVMTTIVVVWWVYDSLFGHTDMPTFLMHINTSLPLFIFASCLNFFRKENLRKDEEERKKQEADSSNPQSQES